jgi:hypothetical protein
MNNELKKIWKEKVVAPPDTIQAFSWRDRGKPQIYGKMADVMV